MSSELVDISWQDRRFQSVGYSPTLGQYYYLVLTDCFFGWYPAVFPVDLPILYPGQYYVIRVRDIQHVMIEAKPVASRAIMRIQSVNRTSDYDIPEAQVLFAQHWVAAFRKLGVVVVGAERIDSKTLGGFLNNYVAYLWCGIMFLLVVATMAFSDPGNVLRNAMICSLIIALVNLIGVCWIRWWYY